MRILRSLLSSPAEAKRGETAKAAAVMPAMLRNLRRSNNGLFFFMISSSLISKCY